MIVPVLIESVDVRTMPLGGKRNDVRELADGVDRKARAVREQTQPYSSRQVGFLPSVTWSGACSCLTPGQAAGRASLVLQSSRRGSRSAGTKCCCTMGLVCILHPPLREMAACEGVLRFCRGSDSVAGEYLLLLALKVQSRPLTRRLT